MAESTLPCASGQGSLDRWNLRPVIGLFFPPTTHPRPLNSFRKHQAKMAAVSVGDIIAIGKLVKDVTKALRDTQGSRAEFAAVCSDLENLQIGVRQTQGVVFSNSRRNRDLNKVVTSTSVLLEEFATMLGKYQPYLRAGGSGNWASDAFRQLQYSMRRPEEVKCFREQIGLRLNAVQMIMSTAN